MHPHGTIVAFSPCLPGWHAVYATEDGHADFESIAGWATFRSHHGDRLVAMTRAFGVAAGLQPADLDPYFTGIAGPGERPIHWDLACRQHLDSLDALEQDTGLPELSAAS
jgi:hypothetical protein